MRMRRAWIECERLAIGGNPFIQPPLTHEVQTEIGVGFGQIRNQLDHPAISLFSTVDVADIGHDSGETDPCACRVRAERNRSLEYWRRFAKGAVLPERDAETQVSVGKVRAQADEHRERLDR